MLNDGPTPVGEGIAHAVGPHHRDMSLDFIAGSSPHRILVTLAACVAVEQGAEAGLGRESTFEHLTALRETAELVGREPAQRIAELRRGRTGAGGAERIQRREKDQGGGGRPHGLPSFVGA